MITHSTSCKIILQLYVVFTCIHKKSTSMCLFLYFPSLFVSKCRLSKKLHISYKKNISIKFVVRRLRQTLEQAFYSNVWHNKKTIYLLVLFTLYMYNHNKWIFKIFKTFTWLISILVSFALTYFRTCLLYILKVKQKQPVFFTNNAFKDTIYCKTLGKDIKSLSLEEKNTPYFQYDKKVVSLFLQVSFTVQGNFKPCA